MECLRTVARGAKWTLPLQGLPGSCLALIRVAMGLDCVRPLTLRCYAIDDEEEGRRRHYIEV